MPLFIRDPEVDALALEVQKATQAPTKTEAVRRALQHELERSRQAQPLRDRLSKAKALADAMGAGDPGFDMKKYTDEMWGNV
jgi:antitoxin VapB